MKLRVLHLIHSAGPYGAEQVILNLGVEMAPSRYQAVVGALADGSQGNEAIARDAREAGLESHIIRLGGRTGLGSLGGLGRRFRELRIDLVHSHGYKPSILALVPCRFARIPLICTCHGYRRNPGLKMGFYHWVEKKALRRMPLVVGVSEDICAKLVSAGVRPERVRFIPNGINTRLFGPFGGRGGRLARMGFADADFVVGHVGRLSREKDHGTLLKALSLLRDRGVPVKCVILGGGPLEGELRERIRSESLQDRVLLAGFVDRPYDIVAGLDCFVLPSIDEGLPIALLEAMALGRACIATPVGEVPKILRDGHSGLIVPVGDPPGLARAIERLHGDGGLRRSLGAEAKKTVEERYSGRAMADGYARAYDEVLCLEGTRA